VLCAMMSMTSCSVTGGREHSVETMFKFIPVTCETWSAEGVIEDLMSLTFLEKNEQKLWARSWSSSTDGRAVTLRRLSRESATLCSSFAELAVDSFRCR
jgi:hypothetical protein